MILKRLLSIAAFATFAAGLSMTASTAATPAEPDTTATPVVIGLGPGSTLWLEGTSTLHDYESRTDRVTIALARDPAAAQPADATALEALIRSSGVRRVDVRVPVLSLRSKKNALDKNLWRSLRAEQHPEIRCRLSRYTLMSGTAGGDTLAIHAVGTLEVAGHSRPIELDARAWRSAEGIWVTGSKPLLMSDYGIKPPTMMLGTLRVGDRVTVHYRLLLEPKQDRDGPASPEAHEKGAGR